MSFFTERPLAALFMTNPRRSSLAVIALIFSSLAEALGASTFFALLSIIGDIGGHKENPFAAAIYNTVDNISSLPIIESLLLLVVIGFLIKNVLLLIAKRYIRYSAIDLQTQLRVDLLSAIMSARWDHLMHEHSGKYMNVMSNEIGRTGVSYIALMAALSMALTSTAYIGVSLTISWHATVFSLATIALALLLSQRLLQYSKRAGISEGALNQSLLVNLSDTLRAVKLYKVMAKEHLAQELLETEARGLNVALRKGAISAVILKSTQEPLFVTAVVAALLVALRVLDLPLAAILALAIIMLRILICVGKFQVEYNFALNTVNGFKLAQDAISQTSERVEKFSAGRQPELNLGIELKDVSFSHLRAAENVQHLSNIEMSVPAKQVTVLIGASGTGKTTILDLIVGLHSPDSGSIEIDGVDLQQLDIKAWRKMIGYVSQESLMLHDTVLRNLTLGDDSFSEQDVIETLQATHAYEFVSALPDGVETVLDEGSTNLSGGQRQRLMIARALLHHPKILILDEATASLDPVNTKNICETLLELKDTTTILMITHQPEIAQFADQMYSLEKGVLRRTDAESAEVHVAKT